MRPIIELERQGYRFWLEDDLLLFEYHGNGEPDPAAVEPLLADLKAGKAEAIRYLREIDFPTERKKALELLDRQDWCAVRSLVLGGETVVWVRDEQVVLPARWRDSVTYTMEELAALAVPPPMTPAALRQIHEAKRAFSGRVLLSDRRSTH